MTDDQFRIIKEMNDNGGHFWICVSCKAGSKILKQQLVKMDTRLTAAEEKLVENDALVKANTDNIADLRKKVETVQETSQSAAASAEDAVLAELADRKYREANLVVHRLAEPDENLSVSDKKDKDAEALVSLMGKAGCSISKNDIKFCSRLGTKKDDTSRPLLVGMKDPELRHQILSAAPKLADTDMKNISVVPDLTARQRKEESNMRKEAEKRNEELTEEESLNYVWKTVGPRGEKRLVKVRIREGETQQQQRNKRRLSPTAQTRSTRPRTNQGSDLET